jgi:hypothetical protein
MTKRNGMLILEEKLTELGGSNHLAIPEYVLMEHVFLIAGSDNRHSQGPGGETNIKEPSLKATSHQLWRTINWRHGRPGRRPSKVSTRSTRWDTTKTSEKQTTESQLKVGGK